MRHIVLGIILILAMVATSNLAASVDAPSASPSATVDKISIKSLAAPNEKRDYNYTGAISGKMPISGEAKPLELDRAFASKIRLSYGIVDADGISTVEMTLLEGQITVQGQKLEVPPNIYPKLTALLDRSFEVTQFYGLSDSLKASSTPGINYGNLIILFTLHGGSDPHAVGDKWKSEVKLGDETYEFVTTLKSVGETGGVKVATVDEDISWVPNGTSGASKAKASAESVFALTDGKLIKSHIECEVAFGGSEEKSASRANIKIDISLAK